jgi:hypothetical protein
MIWRTRSKAICCSMGKLAMYWFTPSVSLDFVAAIVIHFVSKIVKVLPLTKTKFDFRDFNLYFWIQFNPQINRRLP